MNCAPGQGACRTFAEVSYARCCTIIGAVEADVALSLKCCKQRARGVMSYSKQTVRTKQKRWTPSSR